MSNFHIPTKVLNLIDTRPKDNEVKGAVKLDPDIGSYISDKEVNNATPLPQHTFATFDKQDQSLADFIKKLCIQLGISDANFERHKNYALMPDDRFCFVTEQNKHNIQQGFILKLTASPTIYAQYFLTKMSSSSRPLTAEQFSLFGSLCMDPAFAEAFHSLQGIEHLISIIEEAADWHPFFDSNGSGSMLLGLMHALLQFMQHFSNLLPWNQLSTQFVQKIAFFVNGQSKLEQNDSRALALDMLLMLAEHCEHLQECLKREIPVDSLIRHLDNPDQRVLQGSLFLINSIYALADREERIAIVKTLHERPFIAAISRVLAKERPNNVIVTGEFADNRPELEDKIRLSDLLSRLQHIRFDEVRALALRLPSDNEIDFLKTLDEFRFDDSMQFVGHSKGSTDCANHAFEMERTNVGGFYENGPFQRSNKQRWEADWQAFRKMVQSAPPGLLAICTILDIIRPPQNQTEQQQQPSAMQTNQAWTKLQELNVYYGGKSSLFPQILSHLTTMLIQILGICGNSTVGQRFGISRQPRLWQIVFKCERPFYELFRVLVELFHRTWRDMNAKPNELVKVYSVVQDQFERAMVEDPDSIEQLEVEMLRKRFSYSNMQKIWKREQLEQDELEMNSEDIQPLRDHLRPEFERLACRRRIAMLKKGLTFQRVLPSKSHKEGLQTPTGSQVPALSSSTAVHSSPVHSTAQHQSLSALQHWFWRLDDREKNFHFWDCRSSDSKHSELVLDSQGKLPVAQIRAVVHGPEFGTRLSQQHGLKLHKKGQNLLRCGFCLDTHSAGEYFLCARSEQELANWLEALNCLCWPQQALQNASLRAEVDRLLRLEVHIRLMDIPRLATTSKRETQLQKENVPNTIVTPVPSLTDLSWIPQHLLNKTTVLVPKPLQ